MRLASLYHGEWLKSDCRRVGCLGSKTNVYFFAALLALVSDVL